MSKTTRELIAIIDTKLAGIDKDFTAAVEKVSAGFKAKIEKLQAEKAELLVKAEGELDLSRVEQGTEVRFTYGRADTRKEYTGTVLGRKAQPKGADLIKVSVGEGFDAQVLSAYIHAVTAVGPFVSGETTEA